MKSKAAEVLAAAPGGSGPYYGLTMELADFQFRYQTLKANHGQSVFHDNINKSKHVDFDSNEIGKRPEGIDSNTRLLLTQRDPELVQQLNTDFSEESTV
ncbi:hypothetical protein EVAR_87766_1 [Eumeta japonica]|uniref:Uncharacterized protein n=1 Tax=Eumeta variegata TaxID=151549 RepID=A0A4C1X753_EUMVA|nr:hypothetical protein EVAR_87766_1 [Eumeta japonica]